MSYVNKSTLAESPTFRARILATIAEVAGEVLTETGKPPAQATKRLALATQVLADPAMKVGAFVWPVIANPVIGNVGEDASDGDLKFQVTQMWDSVAGVTAADKGN